MIWTVEWTAAAKYALSRIHWRDGTKISAAIMHFAVTGEGARERFAADDKATVRLRATGCG